MSKPLQNQEFYEFNPFRVDVGERILSKGQQIISLTPKAFETLVVLLRNSGHVVEKDELLKQVWPDTFVEEGVLAVNVAAIRKALSEGEASRSYIETVPRRGYRFMGEVQQAGEASEGRAVATEPAQGKKSWLVPWGLEGSSPPQGKSRSSMWSLRWMSALAALICILVLALTYWPKLKSSPPKILGHRQVTNDGRLKGRGRLVTDGPRLYYSDILGGRVSLAQVSTTGGECVPVPTDLPNPQILDISPTRTELLVVSRPSRFEEGGPFWVLPLPSGLPRRLGDLGGSDAAWSPNGQQIVYAKGRELFLARSDGSESRKLVTLPMPAHSLSWSPDGNRLRFDVTSPDNTTSLFEVAADGSNVQPLLPGWNNPPMECGGNWTVDGNYFLFLSTRSNGLHIWAKTETRRYFSGASQAPIQLTSGPLSFGPVVSSKDSKSLFAVGAQARGELVRYDSHSHQFVPYLGGISAQMLDFSRDGQWVTYVTYPEGALWRSKVDGSQRLQLTSPPMQAEMPRWSPDSKQIAFVDTDRYSKICLIPANGGEPKQLMPGQHNESDPGWFPDGKRLLFLQFPLSRDYLARDSWILKVIDLRTDKVSTVSGLEGLTYPRLSPDGRYVCASAIGTKKHGLLVFDFITRKQKVLLDKLGVNHRNWSRSGDHIYFETSYSESPALCRVRVSDGKLEKLASLKDFRLVESIGVWSGLARDGSPLVLHDIGMEDIYRLDWESP